MRIVRLAVRGFRKLREGIEIVGFEPDLTVIAGDNEEGKSTLLKALQSAFFDRHDQTGQFIKEIMPFGSRVRPEIEVDFELNGTTYRLEKGFAQTPSASLIRNDGESVWRNDSAEDTLRELLGFTRPGRGAAKEEHRGLAGLLWVEQGRAFAPLRPNEDSRRALHDAVEGEVGQVLGGDRGRDLLTAARKRESDYFTPKKGRDRDRLISPRRRLDELKREYEKLKEDGRSYDEKVVKLGKLQRRLAQYKHDDRLGAATTDVERAEVAVRSIEAIENKIETAKAHADSAEARARSASQEYDRRQGMVVSLEKKEREAEDTRSTLRDREMERDAARRDYDTARHALEELRGRLDEARDVHREAQRLLERSQIAAALRDPENRLQSAELLSRKIDKKREVLAGFAIDDGVLDRLRTLSGGIREREAALDAVATSLTFAPDGDNAVVLGDRPVDTDKPLRITDATVLQLQGFGTLEILPGGENIAELHREKIHLEGELRTELRVLDAVTVAEAEKEHLRKQKLSGEVQRLKGQLRGLAGGGLDELRTTVREKRRELARRTVEADGDPPPVERARSAESAARDRQDEAQQAESEAVRTKDNAGERHHRAQQRCIETVTKSDHEAAVLAAEREALEEARRDSTDERLRELADEARQAHERCRRERDELISGLEARQPDSARDELARARDARDRLQETIEADEREARDLTVELRALGQKGLAEELERTNGDLESARRELERVELDAKAWRLLSTTLQEAEREAKARFLAPVKNRLRPYLRVLFPGAEVRLREDDFEIVTINRDGTEEPFESLSIGTREQIAVLIRLALADLLRERNEPVALILDDPLVNSDDERFGRMRTALRRAAKNVQIVVLTCHEDRYTTLGARTIRLSDCWVR